TSLIDLGRIISVKHEQNTRRCACLAGCNSTAGAHPASGRRGLLSIRYLWLFALFTAGTDEKESDQTVRKSPRRPTVSIPDPGTRRGDLAVRSEERRVGKGWRSRGEAGRSRREQ